MTDELDVVAAIERAGLDPESVDTVIGGLRVELTPFEYPRPWMRAFVAVLARTGDISSACRSAEINRTYAYEARKTHPVFAEGWREAFQVSVDLLEQIAIRRATIGEDETTTTTTRSTDAEGNVTETIVTRTLHGKRNDTLLMFLLRARRPDTYRETVDHRHGGDPDSPVRVEVYRQPDADRVLELARLMVAEIDPPADPAAVVVEGTAKRNGRRNGGDAPPK